MTESLGVWVRRWIECRMAQIPFARVKKCYDAAALCGIPIEWKVLFMHLLAGGDLNELIDGLQYARAGAAKLTVQQACAYQLYARARYQISLRDWLVPFIQSGIRDLGAISLSHTAVEPTTRSKPHA